MSIVKKEDKSPRGGKSLNSGDVEFSCRWFLLKNKNKKIVTAVMVAQSSGEGQWKSQSWMKAEKAHLESHLLF